ncbi:hypothetical protein H0N96_00425 [Candidatus Micrarchaeota archaeon]|nr:hypothetical protein [Candidatus Micrarchaeota archaeon]
MEFIAVLLTGVFMFTPGILLSFALLKGIKLGLWEKTILGIVLGIIAVPGVSFLEFLFLGLKFNALLVMANAVGLSAIAVFALWKQKQSFDFWKPAVAATPETAKAWKKWLFDNWPALVVIAVMLFGFYARFATSWATNFFEFDPIYYDKLTERLVQNGFIETFSQEAYYPEQAFQRFSPMIHYLSGSWYLIYHSIAGGPFSKDALMLTGQLYPPFVGALLSFLAFLIVKEEYNKYVAVIPALLFAFTPQLVKKLAAGVNEQQPWGIFAALLLFTLFTLAVSKKSRRLALFAGIAAFAAVLGSQHYIWPVTVLAAFIGIQAILDFLKNELDDRLLVINGIVVASAVASNVFLWYYQLGYSTYLSTSMILIASFVFSAALYGLTKFMKITSFKERVGWLAGALVVVALIVAVTPLGATLMGYLTSTSRIAVAGCGVSKTIQEEGATSSALFQSAYGILNPPLLLLLAAVLSGAAAVLALFNRKKRDYAIAGAVIIFTLIAFNAQIDAFLAWFASGIGSQDLSTAIQFFSENDVFLYMLIALVSTAVTYLAAESGKAKKSAVLFVLIFFPIAYVGLNKLKYMVHLAFALALAAGYVLGEALRVIEDSNDWLHFAKNKESLSRYAIAGVLAIGLIMSALQAQTVGQSMNELSYTRIPSDWIQAYDWMRLNTPQDARVMSWWDYGHWTTYFGERNTVLDPNNAFSKFDQGVAQAFVNGQPQDLYQLMNYHKATHVLVDSDLISKWGALVFLSCSCDSSLSPVCPVKAETDACLSPGSSTCEAEHYDEYLDVIGECPPALTPVALPALGSSFGATYCAGQNELFLATRNGLDQTYKRKYQILGNTQIDPNNLDPNTSYLIGMSQGKFINVNPYLPSFNNKVFYSAFTRLFFFETYPGFKLVYKSPNGIVKIFEYTGEPPESEWIKVQAPANVQTPTATPSATPSASETPSPSIEQNASNEANQTNSS